MRKVVSRVSKRAPFIGAFSPWSHNLQLSIIEAFNLGLHKPGCHHQLSFLATFDMCLLDLFNQEMLTWKIRAKPTLSPHKGPSCTHVESLLDPHRISRRILLYYASFHTPPHALHKSPQALHMPSTSLACVFHLLLLELPSQVYKRPTSILWLITNL